jgi:nicotinate-nucleotide pyrophosphorylase
LAIKIFKELGEYEDSQELLEQAKKLCLEKGKELLERHHYCLAGEKFHNLGDYSELLAELVKRNHRYAEFALRTAIEHNQNTYDLLKKQIEASVNDDLEYYKYADETYLEKMKKESLLRTAKEIDFYEKLHVLGFADYRSGNITKTNIVRVSKKSSDLVLNHLIDDVNSYYDKIIHIQDEYAIQETE